MLSLLLVAGCGSGDSASDTTAPGAPATTTTSPPPEPGDVVLSITSEGGFVPVEFAIDPVPRYVLAADRSLYYQGPIPEIFPGPLLPNIQVTELSEADYEEVMRLVAQVGFPEFDERSNDDAVNQVADAATDVFRYHDDEGVHRYSVYALGLVQGGGQDLVLLTEILDVLDQASFGEGSQSYQGERLQVIAGEGMGVVEPQFSTEAEWPLEVPYEEMDAFVAGQRCVVLEGDEAETAYQTFAEANQGHVWGPDGLTIRPRPLLPGEEGCMAPEGMADAPPVTAPPTTIAGG
jgi:hypothetical protein